MLVDTCSAILPSSVGRHFLGSQNLFPRGQVYFIYNIPTGHLASHIYIRRSQISGFLLATQAIGCVAVIESFYVFLVHFVPRTHPTHQLRSHAAARRYRAPILRGGFGGASKATQVPEASSVIIAPYCASGLQLVTYLVSGLSSQRGKPPGPLTFGAVKTGPLVPRVIFCQRPDILGFRHWAARSYRPHMSTRGKPNAIVTPLTGKAAHRLLGHF